MKSLRRFCLGLCALALSILPALAQEDATAITITNGQKRLDLPLFPGTDRYVIHGGSDLNSPLSILNTGTIAGFSWTDLLRSSQ